MQKSKDIDIIVELKELQKFKTLNLNKDERLKKYEIKIEEIDVDIYVPFFSKLVVPVEDIKNYTTKLEGFRVAIPEVILILKQSAEMEREFSVKGEKDRIDILGLLLFSDFDFGKYREIIKRYDLPYGKRLKSIVKNFQEADYLNLNLRELKLRKKKILEKLK